MTPFGPQLWLACALPCGPPKTRSEFSQRDCESPYEVKDVVVSSPHCKCFTVVLSPLISAAVGPLVIRLRHVDSLSYTCNTRHWLLHTHGGAPTWLSVFSSPSNWQPRTLNRAVNKTSVVSATVHCGYSWLNNATSFATVPASHIGKKIAGNIVQREKTECQRKAYNKVPLWCGRCSVYLSYMVISCVSPKLPESCWSATTDRSENFNTIYKKKKSPESQIPPRIARNQESKTKTNKEVRDK